MHKPVAIHEQLYWVGVNDWETDIFEALWPLPQGVSYNAYLLTDTHTALVDTVKSSFLDSFLERLYQLLPAGKGLDYLIINHMEPDHSGAIRTLLHLFPHMQIVGNAKTAGMLEAYYGIRENVKVVADGDTLSLGQQELTFYLTPMVHWPETMMTYESRQQVLFSGDAFGGFGALEGDIFGDNLDLERYEPEALRYYANIVGKYSNMVQKALARLQNLPISTVAATHGPVFRNNAQWIVSRYDAWSRYEAEPGLVIAYASMYGHTEAMAEAVAVGSRQAGLAPVMLKHVSRTSLSELIALAWRYQGLVLGSCAYNGKAFPYMDLLARQLDNKLLQNRQVGLFGSYSWGGGGLRELQKFADEGKWNLCGEAVAAQGAASDSDLTACENLGAAVAQQTLKASPKA